MCCIASLHQLMRTPLPIGKTKPEAEEAFGKENVALWASSYDVAPHPMSTDGPYYPKDDRRYIDNSFFFVGT